MDRRHCLDTIVARAESAMRKSFGIQDAFRMLFVELMTGTLLPAVMSRSYRQGRNQGSEAGNRNQAGRMRREITKLGNFLQSRTRQQQHRS
jgi:hypothetical protein